MATLDRGMMQDRLAAMGRGEFDPLTGELAPGFAGQGDGAGAGRGGFQGRGGRGGPGGPGRGGANGFIIGGRGGRQNGFTATTNYSFGGSALDAAPYQLRPDSPTPKRPYTKQNFGITIGGPLKIPHVYDGSKTTTVIASYTGNRSGSLFDQFATVPSAAMRAGDFSGISGSLIDPATGLPFANNQIPASSVNPAALSLLQFLPLPNLPGNARNFHYTTTTASATNNLNLRVIHSFTPAAGGGRGGGGFGRGGGGRFGGPGGRGRQGTNVTLTAQLQYRTTSADQPNIFPTLGGSTSGSSLAVPVTLNIQHNGSLHNISANLSQTHSASVNQYAYVDNVTGDAGITGVATDPFSRRRSRQSSSARPSCISAPACSAAAKTTRSSSVRRSTRPCAPTCRSIPWTAAGSRRSSPAVTRRVRAGAARRSSPAAPCRSSSASCPRRRKR